MSSPKVSGPVDAAGRRLINRARVASYVLAGLGALALSCSPAVLHAPEDGLAHVLLYVVRPIAAAVLILAAAAVQVLTGLRWRRGLRKGLEDATGLPSGAAQAGTSSIRPPEDGADGPGSTG